jgi:hypothetical protein
MAKAMEIKPKLLAHWDSFNKYMACVWLCELGNLFLTRHEIPISQYEEIKYWTDRESADAEVEKIRAAWREELRDKYRLGSTTR